MTVSKGENFLAAVLSTAAWVSGRMGEKTRWSFAKRMGALGALYRPQRRAVKENLKVINEWAGTHFSPHRVFENFALTLSDFLCRIPVRIEVEGREKAEAARAAGQGVMVLTSHLGHWELGGQVLAQWGWPATAVYKPYTSTRMQKFIQSRRAQELDYLAVGAGAARGLARLLREKRTVVVLGDRPFGEDGEEVMLCGRPAKLPKGPFLLSTKYGTPILPGFVVRESPGCYRAIVEDPIWPSGHGPEAARELLQATAGVLEKYVARYGDQWYCFERVWDSP